jgi:HTH-type transcriptional regulator, transcriptional repressor of NAD biosynthesis genes
VKRYGTGLVVGKFAPLHRGHAKVIEAAMAACDQVVIISYSSREFAGCEPATREGWLAAMFPSATRLVVTTAWLSGLGGRGGLPARLPADDAPDDVHRDFVARLCDGVLGVSIDAVFTSESYGLGLAAWLTRQRLARDPAAPATVHVSVDPGRREHPVSGTALREDPWVHWGYLPAPVARSLVKRVVFLGGESTGKSTMARRMAGQFETNYVAEYGRELWEARGGNLAYDDLLAIATEQLRRESAGLDGARAFLFCDTSPLTTLFYSQHLFSRADPLLELLATRAYDYVFLCEADFAFVQDGTRAGVEFQALQQAWYRRELVARGIAYRDLGGTLKERIALVSRIIRPAPIGQRQPS